MARNASGGDAAPSTMRPRARRAGFAPRMPGLRPMNALMRCTLVRGRRFPRPLRVLGSMKKVPHSARDTGLSRHRVCSSAAHFDPPGSRRRAWPGPRATRRAPICRTGKFAWAYCRGFAGDRHAQPPPSRMFRCGKSAAQGSGACGTLSLGFGILPAVGRRPVSTAWVSEPEAFSGLKSTTLAPWTVILLGLVIRDLGKRKRGITSWLLLDVFRTDQVPRSLFASQKTPREPEGRSWRRLLGRRRACRGARDGGVFVGGRGKRAAKSFPSSLQGFRKKFTGIIFFWRTFRCAGRRRQP